MVTSTPTPSENIRPVHIEEEMRTSYLYYAMSVIVSRALPDVRDGLKPVRDLFTEGEKSKGFISGGGGGD